MTRPWWRGEPARTIDARWLVVLAVVACGRSELSVAPALDADMTASDDSGLDAADDSSGSTPGDEATGPGTPASSGVAGSTDAPAGAQPEAATMPGLITSPGPGADASLSTGDASATCTAAGGYGGTGNGQCDQTWVESCGGTMYEVDCSCPRGTCVCFGPTTHVVPYAGCPACPAEPQKGSPSVFALCGLPGP